MASFHPGRQTTDPVRSAGHETLGDGVDAVLAPVIAGAYARGIAETLEALGLPGLLLDHAGAVIFASRDAQPLLQGTLRLHMRHLVAEQAQDNRDLAAFLAAAVAQNQDIGEVRLAGSGIALRRLPRSEAATLPGQIVGAVVLLAEAGNARHAALLQALA